MNKQYNEPMTNGIKISKQKGRRRKEKEKDYHVVAEIRSKHFRVGNEKYKQSWRKA